MFRLEEEKNSRGTVMSGSAIRGRQGSERFFTLPAVTLIASSFVLGMSDFVVVGILSDIAHGLRVLEVASVVGVPVGTWVANTFGWRWAFHLVNVLTVVLIVLMVMVLPRNSRIVKIGFLPQFRMRAGNGCLSALRLRTIPGR